METFGIKQIQALRITLWSLYPLSEFTGVTEQLTQTTYLWCFFLSMHDLSEKPGVQTGSEHKVPICKELLESPPVQLQRTVKFIMTVSD